MGHAFRGWKMLDFILRGWNHRMHQLDAGESKTNGPKEMENRQGVSGNLRAVPCWAVLFVDGRIEVNNARFAPRDVAFTDIIQCFTTQLSCFELQLFMVMEVISYRNALRSPEPIYTPFTCCTEHHPSRKTLFRTCTSWPMQNFCFSY